MTEGNITLDRLLDPFGQILTPEVARRLVDLRAADDVQQRLDLLLDRNREGRITPEEKAELETIVVAGELISILQAKARLMLSRNTAA